jgi:hypothetical protein
LAPKFLEGNEMVAVSVKLFKGKEELFASWRKLILFLSRGDDISELIEIDVPVLVYIKLLKDFLDCFLLIIKKFVNINMILEFLSDHRLHTLREINPLQSESIFLNSFLRVELCFLSN